MSILGSSNSRRYYWILKLFVAIEKMEVWEQNCVWLFYHFNFERNYEVLKSKSPGILLYKNINFNKNGTESKMEIPHTVSERQTLCFSSNKNRKLKVKLWWVGARERQKRAFFVLFILSEDNFFKFVLLPCIVYWIHFQNMHTFTYEKTLFHTLFCLFLKSSEAFSVSLIALEFKVF